MSEKKTWEVTFRMLSSASQGGVFVGSGGGGQYGGGGGGGWGVSSYRPEPRRIEADRYVTGSDWLKFVDEQGNDVAAFPAAIVIGVERWHEPNAPTP